MCKFNILSKTFFLLLCSSLLCIKFWPQIFKCQFNTIYDNGFVYFCLSYSSQKLESNWTRSREQAKEGEGNTTFGFNCKTRRMPDVEVLTNNTFSIEMWQKRARQQSGIDYSWPINVLADALTLLLQFYTAMEISNCQFKEK